MRKCILPAEDCAINRESVPLSARAGGKKPQMEKFFYCASEPGRTRFGTDMVVRMVSICERLGYEHIKGLLVGDGHDETENATEYYVWVSQGSSASPNS